MVCFSLSECTKEIFNWKKKKKKNLHFFFYQICILVESPKKQKCKFSMSVLINPHLLNELPHPYQLDEFIFHLRGVWCSFFIFIIFLIEIHLSKQCRHTEFYVKSRARHVSAAKCVFSVFSLIPDQSVPCRYHFSSLTRWAYENPTWVWGANSKFRLGIPSLFGITRLCRVMQNSDPEGRNFLSAPNTHVWFFFLANVSISNVLFLKQHSYKIQWHWRGHIF